MRLTQFLTLLLLWPLAGNLQARVPEPDVRVVIDVSGSMKQNDPHNLRAPALKLLVGLLPDEAHAGVWTFGRYVNMAVKYGPVNENWRQQARQAATRIHSRGLFTNIEEALARASFNWRQPDPRRRRHLILLTDGMVDVSGDGALDQASRRRILTQLLPRLKRAGVRVHSVALSAAVDGDLLSRLSGETDGWYEQVASADALQRVFLRLFEKTAPRDALPIKANRFRVDAGIKDMTLLVFRPAGGSRLKVHAPAGDVWQASRVPGHVTWFQEQGYDLITVKQPSQGEWRLETPPDPDNRVMVATNLQLEVGDLPETVVGDASLSVVAHLAQSGQPIRRGDFLKLVQFTLQQRAGHEPENSHDTVLQDRGDPPDHAAGDGIYSQRVEPLPEAGLQQLVVHADAATFQRERRHVFHYYPSLLQIHLQPEAGSHGILIRVRPEAALLDPASVQLEVHRQGSAPLKMTRQGREWQLRLESSRAETITIHLQARGRDGQLLSRDYTQQLSAGMVSPGKEQMHAAAPAVAAHPASSGDGNPESTHVDWKMLIGITLIINLFLLANVLLTHLYLKRRRARREAREAAELSL